MSVDTVTMCVTPPPEDYHVRLSPPSPPRKRRVVYFPQNESSISHLLIPIFDDVPSWTGSNNKNNDGISSLPFLSIRPRRKPPKPTTMSLHREYNETMPCLVDEREDKNTTQMMPVAQELPQTPVRTKRPARQQHPVTPQKLNLYSQPTRSKSFSSGQRRCWNHQISFKSELRL